MATEALLYEHDDGRYAVSPGPEAAIFSHGDPAWHRLGPVDLSALAAPPVEQQAAQTRVWRGGGTLTVADLVNNLLMLDQELPIYGAQYIEHRGQRRAIAVHPTVSRERVADARWIGEGQSLNAAVIWTRAEQPSQDANARRWRWALAESPEWTYAVCKWDGCDWLPIKTEADISELDAARAAQAQAQGDSKGGAHA